MLFGRHLGFQGQFRKGCWPSAMRERSNSSTRWKRSSAKPRNFMKVGAVWQFFEAERDGNSIRLFAPGGAVADSHFSLSAPARGRTAVPERLHSCPRAKARAIISHCLSYRRREASAKNPKKPRPPANIFSAHGLQALAIETAEGRRRVAASPHSRRLGFSRSAHHDHAGAVHFALSRQALQLRLSRVPESRRSGRASGNCCVRKRSGFSSPKA